MSTRVHPSTMTPPVFTVRTAVVDVATLKTQVAMLLRLRNRRWTLSVLVIELLNEPTCMAAGPFP